MLEVRQEHGATKVGVVRVPSATGTREISKRLHERRPESTL